MIFLCYRHRNSEALLLIKNAFIIVNHWKAKYSQCQKDIQKISEKYRKSWAWKFDENIIFNKLNFVGLFVKDLAEIFEVKFNIKIIYLF